ncbi:hypothetical protein [Streptomyces torulosus]|uniref:hypothetical protein n=1 Tax=Streptomyces torulosus TaxID=68276 RepID=UPI000B159A7B|nr:hypothetical protein [Streptomyces torulosus]
MSAATVPTVWALSRPVRDGVRCLRCSLPLDDERVPAGIARGYWGAHDLSVTVYAHPACMSPRPGG